MRFRAAVEEDVPAIVALLRDDVLGATRETREEAQYRAAFRAMAAEPGNHLIVGEADGRIVATFQMTVISGLSLGAARRAQIEAVRVARDLRGQGLGRALFDEIDRRARAEGCQLVQLTTNAGRTDARRFYDRLGFTPSHIGYKRELT